MENNDFMLRELRLLQNEIKQKDFVIDIKKRSYANDIKTGVGIEIKETLDNKIKPKKQKFWDKIKIALFG